MKVTLLALVVFGVTSVACGRMLTEDAGVPDASHDAPAATTEEPPCSPVDAACSFSASALHCCSQSCGQVQGSPTPRCLYHCATTDTCTEFIPCCDGGTCDLSTHHCT